MYQDPMVSVVMGHDFLMPLTKGQPASPFLSAVPFPGSAYLGTRV